MKLRERFSDYGKNPPLNGNSQFDYDYDLWPGIKEHIKSLLPLAFNEIHCPDFFDNPGAVFNKGYGKGGKVKSAYRTIADKTILNPEIKAAEKSSWSAKESDYKRYIASIPKEKCPASGIVWTQG